MQTQTAILGVTLALILYGVSVIPARISGLTVTKAIVFYIGFLMDAAGTFMMLRLGAGSFITASLHTWLGGLVFLLMGMLAYWAMRFLISREGKYKKRFEFWGVWFYGLWTLTFIQGAVRHMS